MEVPSLGNWWDPRGGLGARMQGGILAPLSVSCYSTRHRYAFGRGQGGWVRFNRSCAC